MAKDMDQHFLVNKAKIAKILEMAEIKTEDHIAELGAGQGTIAKYIDNCRQLDLIDLDENLYEELRKEFSDKSHVRIYCQDALAYLKETKADKIISNLPYFMTQDLIRILTDTKIKLALVTVKKGEPLNRWFAYFNIEQITQLVEDDFMPRQDFESAVFKFWPKN